MIRAAPYAAHILGCRWCDPADIATESVESRIDLLRPEAHFLTMKVTRLGLTLFWLGAAYLFGASWLAMWWIAPVWRDTPAEQFDGTVWAFGGPIFTSIALSVPVGILLMVVGSLLYGQAERGRVALFAAGAVVLGLSLLLVPTLNYYPVGFGILGGLITMFFVGAFLIRARNRRELPPVLKTASDLQMIAHIMFFVAASLSCSALGNPFGGLFFPEKILEADALPWYYSMGTKIAVFFALGFLLSFSSQYVLHRRRASQRSKGESPASFEAGLP